MSQGVVVVIVYSLKSRVMVRRPVRCLKHCDRLSSPPSVMLSQLRIRRDETSNSCSYSLPIEVKSDGVESFKIPKAL